MAWLGGSPGGKEGGNREAPRCRRPRAVGRSVQAWLLRCGNPGPGKAPWQVAEASVRATCCVCQGSVGLGAVPPREFTHLSPRPIVPPSHREPDTPVSLNASREPEQQEPCLGWFAQVQSQGLSKKKTGKKLQKSGT